MVAALIGFNLRGAGFKPRPQVLSGTGRADPVLDLTPDNLTLVFEFKFEQSADEKRLDARLEEAREQIRSRKYGLDDNSQDRVARFAMVFCAAPEKRSLERVELVDEVSRLRLA
ncbi:MAG TPA: PD-(D/E)XK nuclease domain-containing protein [Candidatus Avisuccinivibrio pullicola]|nr:PD-(D/E)XK nuclease domain-containing protein [Candidatus Avisuccinivibrio pullicola]